MHRVKRSGISICLSEYLYIFLSIYIYLSIYLSIYIYVHLLERLASVGSERSEKGLHHPRQLHRGTRALLPKFLNTDQV